MSTKRLFNDGWSFTKQPLGTDIKQVPEFMDRFCPVDLPHDWLIYQSNDLYETGEGWYKRILIKTSEDLHKQFALRFEGVYMDSVLYVNRKKAFEWKYGYSTFECDITDYLCMGENEILMQVRYQSPNSRWYSGAGIYRNVWLKSYSLNHFVSDGIYISTRKQDKEWGLDVTAEVAIPMTDDTPGAQVRICHTVYEGISGNANGISGDSVDGITDGIGNSTTKIIAKKDTLLDHTFDSAAFPTAPLTVNCELSIPSVKQWDIKTPNLYILCSELYIGDQLVDQEINRFGFRTIEYSPSDGFLLNGRKVKIQGTCEHHDLGCLGAAVNRAALRHRLQLLREMGVNAIRTSHNMPSVELMELADEMGFLIDSEAFDM